MKYITKLFLLLLSTFDFAYASEQLVMIVSSDFNNTHAVLTRYETSRNTFIQVGENIPVNIGRNGLAW